ncbi:hypothetical protein B0H14DRAFT_2930610 [Mycena olivaceomarginata]|nr:hypothetical protein B0H14DRAFT_2930610 [Mycena olivaceomarginata]
MSGRMPAWLMASILWVGLVEFWKRGEKKGNEEGRGGRGGDRGVRSVGNVNKPNNEQHARISSNIVRCVKDRSTVSDKLAWRSEGRTHHGEHDVRDLDHLLRGNVHVDNGRREERVQQDRGPDLPYLRAASSQMN